jgi:hypothetical protein
VRRFTRALGARPTLAHDLQATHLPGQGRFCRFRALGLAHVFLGSSVVEYNRFFSRKYLHTGFVAFQAQHFAAGVAISTESVQGGIWLAK